MFTLSIGWSCHKSTAVQDQVCTIAANCLLHSQLFEVMPSKLTEISFLEYHSEGFYPPFVDAGWFCFPVAGCVPLSLGRVPRFPLSCNPMFYKRISYVALMRTNPVYFSRLSVDIVSSFTQIFWPLQSEFGKRYLMW